MTLDAMPLKHQLPSTRSDETLFAYFIFRWIPQFCRFKLCQTGTALNQLLTDFCHSTYQKVERLTHNIAWKIQKKRQKDGVFIPFSMDSDGKPLINFQRSFYGQQTSACNFFASKFEFDAMVCCLETEKKNKNKVI